MDKFLKVSRVIKRRTLAQEVCDGGHVKKNGRTAKPSTPVEVGDVLTVTLGSRSTVLRVLKICETADRKTAGEMFELVAGGSPSGPSGS